MFDQPEPLGISQYRRFQLNWAATDRLVLEGTTSGLRYEFFHDRETLVLKEDADELLKKTYHQASCCGGMVPEQDIQAVKELLA